VKSKTPTDIRGHLIRMDTRKLLRRLAAEKYVARRLAEMEGLRKVTITANLRIQNSSRKRP